MTNGNLYLPTVLPQWGIFAGVVLLTVGYIDKKEIWTRLGWIVLIITGFSGLYFNLFGNLNGLGEMNGPATAVSLVVSTGWQATAGGVLAGIALILFQYKAKRYPILAILTLIYFVLIFFLYTQVAGISGKTIKAEIKSEQKK